jgi:hypothetical protein
MIHIQLESHSGAAFQFSLTGFQTDGVTFMTCTQDIDTDGTYVNEWGTILISLC